MAEIKVESTTITVLYQSIRAADFNNSIITNGFKGFHNFILGKI